MINVHQILEMLIGIKQESEAFQTNIKAHRIPGRMGNANQVKTEREEPTQLNRPVSPK